jgi:hypothetical protein
MKLQHNLAGIEGLGEIDFQKRVFVVPSRLPGNLRSKIGTIDLVYDAPCTYFFPTTDGLGKPMPVYNVKFTATELWGGMAEPNNVYYNYLFETYLQAL